MQNKRRNSLRKRLARVNNRTEAQRESLAADMLIEESFRREALPNIVEAMARGDDLEKMFNDNETAIAARLMSIALGNPDAKVALAALKEITDRVKGRAKETLSLENKLDKMSDAELDALWHAKVVNKVGAGTGSGGGGNGAAG